MASEPPVAVEARVASNSVSINPVEIAKVAAIEADKPVIPVESITEPVTSKVDITPKFFEEEIPDEEETQTEPQDESKDDDIEEVVNPGAEHFRKLRTSQRELKKTLSETTRAKEEIATKLKAYETGEIVSDVLKQKDEEIVRLSHFEKLVNLKGSKEYREKYISPIEESKTKLKEIFADYGIPAESLDSVVNKAINIEKRPELNQFLLEHLGNDELGASEAKAHIVKAWDIRKAASSAEAEPMQALQALQQENEAISQVRETERRTRIIKTAQDTWVESLSEIRAEGKLLELIHKEDDPEFNSFYPDRILPQAAKEYGKMITELGKQGVTDIPKPLAKAIAKMVLLAHSSGVNAETRNRAMEQADSLTQNLTRHHNQLRPQIGGGVSRGNGAAQAPKALTPEQEANLITNQVLRQR